jgi:hypothetical protein
MGSLISALDAIDRYSLENGRPVTLPLLKAAMGEPGTDPNRMNRGPSP